MAEAGLDQVGEYQIEEVVACQLHRRRYAERGHASHQTVRGLVMGVEIGMAMYEKGLSDEFKDVKVLTMFTSPASQIMSNQPVKTLADFNGLPLRASGSILEIISGLGAQGIGMPMSQTPEALQEIVGFCRKYRIRFRYVPYLFGTFVERVRVTDIGGVPLIAATEKVNPKMTACTDAALITQMNRRGQIKGCTVDGPLPLDVSCSPEPCRIKGLDSPAGGAAVFDRLVVER